MPIRLLNPTVTAAFARPAGHPALGGNFGNAVATLGTAANDSAAYFTLLSGLGLRFLRVNYDAGRYLTDDLYVGIVDQIAQHMLAAGVVPCLAPQEMPPGDGLAAQEAALVALAGKVAAKYKGVPVVQDILNEPHLYATWADWRPVAQKCLDAIKAASPDALIVVGGEGYSKDLTGAGADPFPAGAVLAYCLHPYGIAPDALAALCPPALPAWIQEYDDPSAAFHAAVAALPNVIALSAWAWTTPGQDSLNLVQSVDGAALTLTPTGAAIAGLYADWQAGRALPQDAPATVPAAAPSLSPGPSAPALTLADVQGLLDTLKTDLLAQMTADEATQKADEAGLSGISDQMQSATDQADSAATQAGGAASAAAAAYTASVAAQNLANAVRAGVPPQIAAALTSASARQAGKLTGRKATDAATVGDLLAVIAALHP